MRAKWLLSTALCGEKFKFKMAFGHFTQLEVETAVESRLGFVRIFFRLSHASVIAMVMRVVMIKRGIYVSCFVVADGMF